LPFIDGKSALGKSAANSLPVAITDHSFASTKASHLRHPLTKTKDNHMQASRCDSKAKGIVTGHPAFILTAFHSMRDSVKYRKTPRAITRKNLP